jgi:hypothetical protein
MKKVNWAKVSLVTCIVTYAILFVANQVAPMKMEWTGIIGFFLVYGALFSYIAYEVDKPVKRSN